MPGTIQVSVLDLVDLPKTRSQSQNEKNASPLSLKVAMGKREYQSMGKGEFSFPVMSLHENLIVMLHDADGNQIFQTEIKTISVVEKGSWDDFFPLKGGGYVHMKLQFSLSEDERLRIREMRESALKRKHGEQLKDGLKSFVSGLRIGNIVTYSMTELITEVTLFDQPEQTNPDQHGNPLDTSLQPSEERSEHSFERDVPQLTEVNKESLKTQSPLDGTPKQQISSEVGLNPLSGCSRSLVLGNVLEHSNPNLVELEGHIHNANRKNLLQRSSSNRVWKMISALENSQSQRPEPRVGPRTKSLVPKIDVEGSLKRTSSEESDINKLKFPQTMAKSFSAEMLSEINSQQNPRYFQSAYLKKQEEVQQFGRTTWSETMRKINPFLDLKNDQKLKNIGPGKHKAVKVINDDSSSVESLLSSSSYSSAATNNVLENIGTGKVVTSDGSAEHVSEREDPVSIEVKKRPAILSIPSDFKAIEEKINSDSIPKGGDNFYAHIAPGSSDAVPSSDNGEEMEAGGEKIPADEKNPSSDRRDDGNGTSEQSITDYLQLSHEVNTESMLVKKNENEEHTFLEETQLSRQMLDESESIEQPCSQCSYQQGSSLSAVTKESESEHFISRSDEKSVSGTSNETVELLTYSDNERCPFGSLRIWIPRHVCITTGSKRLRDLVGCCNNCGGTHPIEKNTLEANEEQAIHSDTSIQVDENEKITCTSGKPNHENSVGKLNGGLIEQGVRIAIVIIACGTLLFNTRPRNPRQGHS